MSRLYLSSASNGLHPHQYDISSVCSIDFGDLLPVINVESEPTDHWKSFEGKGALRMQAQVFPTFGKAFLKSAAFFVPEHQLYEDAEAFHQNEPMYKGKAVVQPNFYAYTFIKVLINLNYCTLVAQVSDPTGSSAPNPNNYHFVYPFDNNGQLIYNYYRLTRKGDRLYKIYKMLGYDFPSFPFISTSSTFADIRAYAEYTIPAVSILAYAKIYVDMFLSGQAYNTSVVVDFLHHVRNKEDYIDSNSNYWYHSNTGRITEYGLQALLISFVPHESSMYTQAWNRPNSPDGTSNGLYSVDPQGIMSPYIADVSNPNSSSVVERDTLGKSSGANFIYSVTNSSSATALQTLSASGLRFLQAFDKFVRRWNLSGTKAVQKVYAQFGIKSDDFNSHFVHKLFEGSSKIDFSPVLSNADTVSGGNGKRIGDYAGFGVGGLDINFDYKSSDYGQIVVVSWLQIVPMLLRGFDPMNLKTNPQDYYTPEFDGKAFRAIPMCEISVNKIASDDPVSVGSQDTAIYGFTNIYDEYRKFRDRIGGAFVTDVVAKNFLLSRDLSVLRESRVYRLQPQTDDVHYWDNDDNPDVTNPFQNSWNNGDRFYLYIDWNIQADRPMLSESESFDLGTGDIQINKNGDMMS